jgi:hypothetical protein
MGVPDDTPTVFTMRVTKIFWIAVMILTFTTSVMATDKVSVSTDKYEYKNNNTILLHAEYFNQTGYKASIKAEYEIVKDGEVFASGVMESHELGKYDASIGILPEGVYLARVGVTSLSGYDEGTARFLVTRYAEVISTIFTPSQRNIIIGMSAIIFVTIIILIFGRGIFALLPLPMKRFK